MKIYILLITLAASGCGIAEKNEMIKLVPGTYIRFSSHQYGQEWDTLVITGQAGTPGVFKINRKWRYERVLDGVPLEPEYKNTPSTASWSEEKKGLMDETNGAIYRPDAGGKGIFCGNLLYHKI